MNIRQGDTVKISTPGHHPFSAGYAIGTVISANNYGTDDRPDWYIEVEKTDVCGVNWQAGYGYWKQRSDGGVVELLERAA